MIYRKYIEMAIFKLFLLASVKENFRKRDRCTGKRGAMQVNREGAGHKIAGSGEACSMLESEF